MKAQARHILTRDQVLDFRAESHHLGRRLPHAMLLEAADVCGLQNTPPGSAELALHARVLELAPGDFLKALEGDKRLLQLWSLRAAPHVFPTRSAAAFTRGLLPEQEADVRFFIKGVEAALEKVGIQAVGVLELSAAALSEVLDGQALTKDELGIHMARSVLPHLSPGQAAAWQGPSWYAPGQSLGESVVRFALYVLPLRGLLCHAQRLGSQAYLMLTHQWLGSPLPEVDADQARLDLVRRYLGCYAPSTPEHFALWAGISPAQAARAWSLAVNELDLVEYEGRQGWVRQQDLARLQSPPRPSGVRLLPPHDPYLALRDRDTLIPDRSLQRRVWRKIGNPGLVLVDGRPAALWRPQKKGRRMKITLEPFATLPAPVQAELGVEAEILARLQGCSSVEVK